MPIKSLFRLLVLAIFAGSAGQGLAVQPSSIGAFRVNFYTGGEQIEPVVASDAAGNFVVVWQTDGGGEPRQQIWAECYNAAGSRVGAEFPVSLSTTDDQTSPIVAMSPTGEFVVGWTSTTREVTPNSDFYLRRFAAGGGIPRGESFPREIVVHTNSANNQDNAGLAMNPDGSFLATWTTNAVYGNIHQIMARRYSTTGTPGNEFTVSDGIAGEHLLARVATGAAGDSVFVWRRATLTGPGDIVARYYDKDGVPAAAEILVNTYTAGDQTYPSVAALAGGGFVIVWQSEGQDTSGYGVYGQRFGARMTPLGSEFLVNTSTGGHQEAPTVAAMPDGGFLVVYSSRDLSFAGPGPCVAAQRFDADGARVESELVVNRTIAAAPSPTSSFGHAVAVDANGNFVVAWKAIPFPVQPGAQPAVEIVADKFFLPGQTPPPDKEFRVNTTTLLAQRAPAVASDAAGNFVVAWEGDDSDSTRDDIYFQCYDAQGNKLIPERRANARMVGLHAVPSIAMTAPREFVIVWEAKGDGTDNWDIFGNRFDLNTGDAKGAEFQVNSDSHPGEEQLTPAVAGTASGQFVVAWRTFRGGDTVRAKLYRATGGSVQPQPEFQVNVTPGPSAGQAYPSVAMDATGRFVVAWQRYTGTQDQSDIFARVFDELGGAQTSEVAVSQAAGFDQYRASVSFAGASQFVVAWVSENQDGSLGGIYGRRFAVTGAALSNEIPINTYTQDQQLGPCVAGSPDGSFVAAWTSKGQDSSREGIFAQRFDPANARHGGEMQINQVTLGEQSFLDPSLPPVDAQTPGEPVLSRLGLPGSRKVALDPEGNFVVVWRSGLDYQDAPGDLDEDQDGSESGVYAVKVYPPRPPQVSGVSSANPTENTIEVMGQVNPGSTPSRVRVEYGLTTGLGSFSAWQDVGAGRLNVPASLALSGLAAESIYYYRVTVENAEGTAMSGLGTFATAPRRVRPRLAPLGDGRLTINLADLNGLPLLNARWRLYGEAAWHTSGTSQRGLVAGSYVVEFEPVNGVAPASAIYTVSGETTPPVVSYPAGIVRATGAITVTINPPLVGSNPDLNLRGQWRRAGEPAWHDSGEVVPGVPVGAALIEFKPVFSALNYDFRAPGNFAVTVAAGPPLRLTATYLTSASTGGLPLPSALSVQEVTGQGAAAAQPWQFCGQVQSDTDFGSGIAVRPQVVLTAAHVVFDDGTLSFATGVRWIHQRVLDEFEPMAQTPRGFCLPSGYAALRKAEIQSGTVPGNSAPGSQEMDAAAMYFVGEDCARGGASGYLTVDGPTDWLLAARDMTIIGYPAEATGTGAGAITEADFGKMYRTAPAPLAFTQPQLGGNPATRIYRTTQVAGTGGMSGGPLCVQWDDGNYYPAGIYLGGKNAAVVRGIDQSIGALLAIAERAAGGDPNNTNGGAIIVNSPLSAGRLFLGPIKVTTQAGPNAPRWRLNDEKGFPHNSQDSVTRVEGRYTIVFEPAKGFQTPSSLAVEMTDAKGRSLNVVYAPIQKPAILTASLPPAALGLPYKELIISATNQPTAITAITATNPPTGTPSGLPPGLALQFEPTRHVWKIVGTATMVGDFLVRLTASNGGGVGLPVDLVLSVRSPISLTANATSGGRLAVSPDLLDGGLITKAIPGQIYTFSAKPGAGSFFVGWQTPAGLVLSRELKLSLTVQNDLDLIARFIPNPFTPARVGVYEGLAAVGPAETGSRAFVRIAVMKTGTYTGQLLLGTGTYRLGGSFDGAGQALGSITRPGTTPIAYALSLGLSDTTEGTLTGNIAVDDRTLSLAAERALTKAQLATFTMSFPPDTRQAGNPFYPHGTGWARATLGRTGVLTLKGVLGDGKPVTQTVHFSVKGNWPFFARPYHNAGLVMGRLALIPSLVQGDPAYLTGTLDWLKPETSQPVQFSAGFGGTITVEGSQYIPPASGRALDVTPPVVVTISDGGLQTPLRKPVTFGLDNRLTIPVDADNLKMTLFPKLGTFKASFVDRGVTPNQIRDVKGVLLQQQKQAAGLFLTEHQSGSLILK